MTKAVHSLETHLGRKPTEKEIAEELDLDSMEFNRLQRDASAVSVVSLDTQCAEDNSEKDMREIDIIDDKKSLDPLVEAQKRDLKGLLTKGLTRAERLIIVLYYYEEMTMKEIGATLDLSESRVSQMHSSIVGRLKAQMNNRKKEFAVQILISYRLALPPACTEQRRSACPPLAGNFIYGFTLVELRRNIKDFRFVSGYVRIGSVLGILLTIEFSCFQAA